MGQCDLIPIHTVHRADQIGHTVDDCDMRLLSTESARIAELRDAAAWKHCAWARSGRTGDRLAEELRDLPADAVSQTSCSFMSHSLLSALLINEPHRQKTG